MIQFVPMRAEHLVLIGNLVQNQSMVEITPELAVEMEELGGMAAIDGDKVLGVAGIVPSWRGTGHAWAWLTRDWKRHARAITNEVRRVVWENDLPRLEMAVRVDFKPGWRWAERLGFQLETPLARKWGPDGLDYALFARVK